MVSILKIQLEQIRSSAGEVRWAHDEDAEQCQHCKRAFQGNNRKKVNTQAHTNNVNNLITCTTFINHSRVEVLYRVLLLVFRMENVTLSSVNFNVGIVHFQNHCRHCGKIFCVDCLSKTVKSGPKLRPSCVCDVCHTILVQDATPYFSVEAPQTPD